MQKDDDDKVSSPILDVESEFDYLDFSFDDNDLSIRDDLNGGMPAAAASTAAVDDGVEVGDEDDLSTYILGTLIVRVVAARDLRVSSVGTPEPLRTRSHVTPLLNIPTPHRPFLVRVPNLLLASR